MLQFAHHIIVIDPAAPEWAHVIPSAPFAGRDGRGPYRYDAGRLLASTRLYHGQNPIAIDYEHASLKGAKLGAKAPAAGWFREFQVRTDGIWARVDWTKAAADHIAAGEYLFLSPVIPDSDGELLMIFGAALTNNPNLDLAPLRQIDAAMHAAFSFISQHHGADMEPHLKILADMGITEPSEAQIQAAKAMAAHAARADAALTALGLDATCDTDAVTGAVAEIKAAHAADVGVGVGQPDAAAPDPNQFVPRVMFDEMAARVKGLEATNANAAAHSAVDEAIKAGKIAPAQAKWAHGYAVSDPKGFAEFVGQQPVIVVPGGSETGQANGNLPRVEAAHEADVAAMLGISVEDMHPNGKEA